MDKFKITCNNCGSENCEVEIVYECYEYYCSKIVCKNCDEEESKMF